MFLRLPFQSTSYERSLKLSISHTTFSIPDIPASTLICGLIWGGPFRQPPNLSLYHFQLMHTRPCIAVRTLERTSELIYFGCWISGIAALSSLHCALLLAALKDL